MKFLRLRNIKASHTLEEAFCGKHNIWKPQNFLPSFEDASFNLSVFFFSPSLSLSFFLLPGPSLFLHSLSYPSLCPRKFRRLSPMLSFPTGPTMTSSKGGVLHRMSTYLHRTRARRCPGRRARPSRSCPPRWSGSIWSSCGWYEEH